MHRKGQVIILTILILGGTLLGTASIAALLLVYQIRQSTDFGNSGKAIFAADTGIEWYLYDRAKPGGSQLFSSDDGGKTWTATLSNCESGNCPTVAVTCYQDSVQKKCDDSSVNNIRSVGTSNETSRAFQLSF